MTPLYTPPSHQSTSFHCPHCEAFSSISWDNMYIPRGGYVRIEDLEFAQCRHCHKYSLWLEEVMIYPGIISVEGPNSDLPKEVQEDYIEAANILNQSPRGAAALLRLAIEKLVNGLEKKGKDLHTKIGNLVQAGLNEKIQKALDVVRVIGNNAVHPGQIDLKDDSKTAHSLFKLVNIIADGVITQPKEVGDLYEVLVPKEQKKAIQVRDFKIVKN